MSQTHEFSRSKMKDAVKSETNKRVAKEAADFLGEEVQAFLRERSAQSLQECRESGRKTVRGQDVNATRTFSISGHSFQIPNAPVERILRDQGASRVSEDAVEELNREAVDYMKDLAQEADRMAGHAGRNTVVKSDVELALKEVE